MLHGLVRGGLVGLALAFALAELVTSARLLLLISFYIQKNVVVASMQCGGGQVAAWFLPQAVHGRRFCSISFIWRWPLAKKTGAWPGL
ncbi:MAG: hypothetical protein LBF51_09050 [Zoogloeaceae bacterium]|jgi:hypothetical protein|nr:hypothetical protein [Zoogloeaceae bacterium]